jgi:hypothetical protein
MTPSPKGAEAARLRQRKFEVLRRFRIPPDALPGSLALTHRRCGKPTCHCASAEGEGHGMWSLTFMVDGKKRVERVPSEWVEEIRRRVDEGRGFKQAVAEVFTANARLWAIERTQRRK